MMTQKARKKSVPEAENVHWSEWLAGGLSALLVVSLIGWLGYQCYQYQPVKANFRVEVTGHTAVENGYQVAFSVLNVTQSSAAEVKVVGTMSEQNGHVEKAAATLDYVASEAQSSGALFFEQDPRNHNLKLRVVSYTNP